jgi:hypothetical protein
MTEFREEAETKIGVLQEVLELAETNETFSLLAL